MLNIGKLAPGSQDYYLATVASGVEDYYTGSGEAPGYWTGEAAKTFALHGQVDADDLRAILGALDPRTGERLPADPQRRLPGYDLTFRAPKSVAILWALGSGDVARQVRDAHDTAVAEALGYLERHAAHSRRGKAGKQQISVTGFVAAAFRHRSSRAGDPLLHTHVLVSNLGQAVDDRRWRTLDGRSLYAHAKTAGTLYQAQLRHELTRRLGIAWEPVVSGYADVTGIPRELIEAFSQRRAEIVQRMTERGEGSAKAAQTATLATRKAKDYGVDAAGLLEGWAATAAGYGWDTARVDALLDRARQLDPSPPRLVEAGETLAGPRGLTARASTFTRRDVLQAWCAQLPNGAPVPDVERLADAFLSPEAASALPLTHAQATAQRLTSREVIRCRDGRVVAATPSDARYSTPELLALEQRTIERAIGRCGDGAALIPRGVVETALQRRPGLSAEQAELVRHLVGSGAGVQVVIGKAGAGKTFALDAAREAWQSAGVRIVGCALSAQAAAELQAGAGIPSTTLDALLADVERPGPGPGLASGGVVVVDEAGMVGTRKLARLLDHAEAAGAMVVLVGDDRQLPEIDAGGLFRGLAHRLPVVELVENRRQGAVWERAALDELRHGDVAAGVAGLIAHDRVVTAETAEAVREQLVTDWWTARTASPETTGIMVALRVSDVTDLNDRARVRLAAAGIIHGPELDTGDRSFQAGDEVVCLHNDRRLGVLNGMTGRVARVDPTAGTLALEHAYGGKIELTADYLSAGHLTHGYALTAHKAQGTTVDHAWVLGSDLVYREWGYVALSRARHGTRLYLVDGDEPALDEAHTHTGPLDPTDPISELVRHLERERGQHLAIDQGEIARLANRPASELAADRDRLRAAILAVLPRRADQQLASVQREQHEATERLAEARERVRAAAERLERFTGLGRLTRRHELAEARTNLDRARSTVARWEERLHDLDESLAQSRGRVEERDGWLASHHGDLAAYEQLQAALGEQTTRRVQTAEFDLPAYLTEALGQRPSEPAGRRSWRAGVRAIEAYRARWELADPDRALGPPPTDPVQRLEHHDAAAAVHAARQELGLDRAVEQPALDLAF